MSILRLDQTGEIVSVNAIPAQLTAATNTLQATGIDTALYSRIRVVVSVGVVTDGEYVLQVKTSDAVGGTYTDQVGRDIGGVTVADGLVADQDFQTYTSANDERVDVYDVNVGILDGRWLKVNLNESSVGSTGALISVVLLCEKRVK